MSSTFSWEIEFEDVVRQYNLARKRVEALERLYSEGRVSQPIYELLKSEYSQAFMQVENRRNDLLEKLKGKETELRQEAAILERALAIVEVSFSSGEIDESKYTTYRDAFQKALELIVEELESVSEALGILSGQTQASPPQNL